MSEGMARIQAKLLQALAPQLDQDVIDGIEEVFREGQETFKRVKELEQTITSQKEAIRELVEVVLHAKGHITAFDECTCGDVESDHLCDYNLPERPVITAIDRILAKHTPPVTGERKEGER